VERADFRYGNDAATVRDRIASGRFKALVICDLSDTACMRTFESELGSHLKAFVAAGGSALFPTSEGLLLLETLQTLFQVPWRRSGYYRTTWGVPPERAARVAELFGAEATPSFTAKACCLRNAGADACFGVTPESEHESLSLSASPPPARRDAVSVTSPEGLEEDFDVCVAVEEVGDSGGNIAFFGDVNAEYATCVLVAALCQKAVSSSDDDDGTPAVLADVTVSDVHALSDDEFDKVKDLKSRGNDAFRAGDLDEARELYETALSQVRRDTPRDARCAARNEGRFAVERCRVFVAPLRLRTSRDLCEPRP